MARKNLVHVCRRHGGGRGRTFSCGLVFTVDIREAHKLLQEPWGDCFQSGNIVVKFSHSQLQKRRREERLKAQQQSRYNFQKLVRATLEKCAAGVETSERGEEIVEEMPVVEERGKKRKAGEISAITTRDKAAEKAQQKYKDSLMTPEPLEDLPDKDDLAKNWLCVPLPPGRRVLVVANNNATQIRLRNGSLLTSFQSLLPGGGTRHATSRMHCILDCMLCEPFTLFVSSDSALIS